jgi:hypothetical protein
MPCLSALLVCRALHACPLPRLPLLLCHVNLRYVSALFSCLTLPCYLARLSSPSLPACPEMPWQPPCLALDCQTALPSQATLPACCTLSPCPACLPACQVWCFSHRAVCLGEVGTKNCFGLKSKVPFITDQLRPHFHCVYSMGRGVSCEMFHLPRYSGMWRRDEKMFRPHRFW